MRKNGGLNGVWISVVLLAGCQSEAVKFALKDTRVPEQVGLRVEWVRNFGRSGVLADEPTNLGRAYSENGELDLGLFRVTNVGSVSRELYPSVRVPERVAGVTLSQVYWSVWPRSRPGCSDFLEAETRPNPDELLTEYRSEFEIRGASLVFDSGGREDVSLAASDAPRPSEIHPGESATFTIRLGLRPGFPLISGDPVLPGALVHPAAGTTFRPTGVPTDPACARYRTEWIAGVFLSVEADPALLARNPATDELNPVYLGEPSKAAALFTENAAAIKIAFPPSKVAETINGLAVQN